MSAFEADRFNRSRTSPEAVLSSQFSAKADSDVIPSLREAQMRNLRFA
jgi:hypothetical protein